MVCLHRHIRCLPGSTQQYCTTKFLFFFIIIIIYSIAPPSISWCPRSSNTSSHPLNMASLPLFLCSSSCSYPPLMHLQPSSHFHGHPSRCAIMRLAGRATHLWCVTRAWSVCVDQDGTVQYGVSSACAGSAQQVVGGCQGKRAACNCMWPAAVVA